MGCFQSKSVQVQNVEKLNAKDEWKTDQPQPSQKSEWQVSNTQVETIKEDEKSK